jgi:ATP-binding cassette subfamily F protein uup
MRRQPKARTTKSKSRQEDFFIKLKKLPKADEKKIKLNSKYGTNGYKIIELQKKFLRKLAKFFENFSLIFNGARIELLVKNGTGKSTFKFIGRRTFPPILKVITGEPLKLILYAKRN